MSNQSLLDPGAAIAFPAGDHWRLENPCESTATIRTLPVAGSNSRIAPPSARGVLNARSVPFGCHAMVGGTEPPREPVAATTTDPSVLRTMIAYRSEATPEP